MLPRDGDDTEPLLSRENRTYATASNDHRSALDGVAIQRSDADGMIYATPSVILRTSGSVGVALLMWLIGALIAAAGTTVYIELGTGLPRSGGEKNYLEFIYRRPKFMTTCTFSVYALITGSAAANSVVFGEYVIHSLSLTPTRTNTRLVAFLCLTFCLLIHGTLHKHGLRLQNFLGFSKLLILCAIAFSGIFSLVGVPGFAVREPYDPPRNFDSWNTFWEGSGTTGVNAFVTGLYSVIWSFIGYSNANYALSEVKDPIRTIKRAAPLAMLCVAMVYMFVNVAYFAVVSKGDILGSRRIVAALFFRNLFGPTTEKALSVFVAFSVLGNLLAGQFTQGRRMYTLTPALKNLSHAPLAVVQELGREGILPYPSFFASNKPFNAPLAGLFTQYLVSCAFMLAPPPAVRAPPSSPSSSYTVAPDIPPTVSSYSTAIINTLVAVGLLLLYTPSYKVWEWNPPFRAPKAIIVLFCLSNVFLVVVPLIPPSNGSRVYDNLPYWVSRSLLNLPIDIDR
ncbi:hypothetical protein H0H87_002985 [Tephrocybe sp. NHM501043]|nr:hypothetical protein H0H87_002985 [Tephrocybe sp. NHM501043]